ncbi:MAG: putative molybdenum carrier protein [Akkermansiaceae bacterium]|nr:putative molybdenum carrier protein [Armatimonadota bacterium]
MNSVKIISGGQTGADRAALEWALANGVPCGGWCPKGRNAEDGPIDPKYPLTETPSVRYIQRTEWNARDSDATVILTTGTELTEGSLATAIRATKQGKPWLHLSREICNGDANRAGRLLRDFCVRHTILTLNVAGPRASKEPTVNEWVSDVLHAAFRTL